MLLHKVSCEEWRSGFRRVEIHNQTTLKDFCKCLLFTASYAIHMLKKGTEICARRCKIGVHFDLEAPL